LRISFFTLEAFFKCQLISENRATNLLYLNIIYTADTRCRHCRVELPYVWHQWSVDERSKWKALVNRLDRLLPVLSGMASRQLPSMFGANA